MNCTQTNTRPESADIKTVREALEFYAEETTTPDDGEEAKKAIPALTRLSAKQAAFEAMREALTEIKTVVNPILAREFSQEKLIHDICNKALALAEAEGEKSWCDVERFNGKRGGYEYVEE